VIRQTPADLISSIGNLLVPEIRHGRRFKESSFQLKVHCAKRNVEKLQNQHAQFWIPGSVLSLANDSTKATNGTAQASGQHGWVNRSSTIPLYHQLFLTLRDRLFGGEWDPGELFLRDLDIEATYQVSRITVRKAMDGLVNEGLVVRYRGKGTFVAHVQTEKKTRTSEQKPADFASISGPYHKEILEVSKILVSKHTADRLQVPDNHLVSMLRMTHWISDVPVCSEAIFVDNFKWPDVFSRQAVEQQDVSEIYRSRGMTITKTNQAVSAIIPAADTAKQLALAPGQPALFICRVGYAENGTPIDFRLIHCRGDRFVLTQDILAQQV